MKYFVIALSFLVITTIGYLMSPPIILAQAGTTSDFTGINNPVVGNLGGNTPESREAAQDGTLFLRQFVNLWKNAINIGAILLIIFYIWGGLEWITAGGDKGKLENARNKLLQATLGMIILAASFIIIGFVSYGLFGESFDILNLEFLTPSATP